MPCVFSEMLAAQQPPADTPFPSMEQRPLGCVTHVHARACTHTHTSWSRPVLGRQEQQREDSSRSPLCCRECVLGTETFLFCFWIFKANFTPQVLSSPLGWREEGREAGRGEGRPWGVRKSSGSLQNKLARWGSCPLFLQLLIPVPREVTWPDRGAGRKQSRGFNRREHCRNGSQMAGGELWYPLELLLLEYLKSFFSLLNNSFWIRAIRAHGNGAEEVGAKASLPPFPTLPKPPPPTRGKQLSKK